MDIKDLVQQEISVVIKKELESNRVNLNKKVLAYLSSKQFLSVFSKMMKQQVYRWLRDDYDFIDDIPQSIYDKINKNALKAIFKD